MEKKAPPPPPRGERPSLRKDEKQEEVEEPQAELEATEEEEVLDESKAKEIQNGVEIKAESVGPNEYNLYRVVVKGKEDDIVVLSLKKKVHAATINLFVNIPPSPNEAPSHYPTFRYHDWNPSLGQLGGPVGEYRISVQGVPSYIEKDTQYLVDPKNNTASYDLLVEYSIVDEETKLKYKQIAEQYSREKSSSVWESSYSKEVLAKYQQQQEEYEREQREREEALNVAREVPLEGTPIVAEYDIGATLASGDFTAVKRAKNKKDNKEYAVKIIDKDAAKSFAIDDSVLKQQINILQSVNHKNICSLKQVFETDRAICLVLELEGKDIIKGLSESDKPYTEADARRIIHQLLSAVQQLHAKNIIHKSLVPENILFSAKNPAEITLVGFTLSQISKDDSELTVSGGDVSFQAPELIQQQSFGRAIDMWSIGCISYILLSGKHPFKDSNLTRLKMKIREGTYQFPDEDWKSVPEEAKDFIKKLLCVDAAQRATADAALQHAWISSTKSTPLNHVKQNLSKYYE